MSYYFYIATLLMIGLNSFAGCGFQTITKAENSNQKNLINTAKGENTELQSANQSDQSKPQILWDFRKNESVESPKISKAETKVVLNYLFGEKANPEIEITNRVSGSFTKPNAKETLYYISGCEPDGVFVSDYTCNNIEEVGWIAIYDGTTPVTKIKTDFGGTIEKVTDINNDGISEILSTNGYGGQGITTLGLSIGQISGNKYEDIKGFSGYADTCGNDKDDSTMIRTAKAAVISYVPTTDGKFPVFTEEYFQGRCGENGMSADPQWKKITEKQFDDFYKSLT